MPRGKAKANLELIEVAHDIGERNNPITIRGIAYKLFVKGIIPSMAEKYTKKVSQQLTDAREQNISNWGEDWEWIVDETREAERIHTWDSPRDILEAAAKQYRRNLWKDQPAWVEVWSEKGTVRGVLAPVLDEFGITFRVMHGYSSYTAIKQAAQEVENSPKRLDILYVGDWDPSGMAMSELDIPDRMNRYGGQGTRIHRIAIAQQDCVPSLPWFPASDKVKDRRYPWFVANYGDKCWELDAMDEVILRDRVRNIIKTHIDWKLWNHQLMVEKKQQESMGNYLDLLDKVLKTEEARFEKG
jgi:hypothetical protein